MTSAPGRLSVRFSGLRECKGEHTQATLIRPRGEETLCADCRERSGRDARENRRPGTPRTSGVPGLGADLGQWE
ncbi:hypothetical protein [Streptomyces sp. NPDC000983]|uniref:hypothetical protein n=1 Tax=Streptomyces sp. NPDC000983 TaxID=3154373 RepID=UPI003319AB62